MTKRAFLAVFVVSVLATLSAGVTTSAMAQSPNPFALTFKGVKPGAAAGTYTWTYELTWSPSGGDPALSHFGIEFCNQITKADIVSATVGPLEGPDVETAFSVGYDASLTKNTDCSAAVTAAPFYGIKWEVGGEINALAAGETRRFTFTMKGAYAEGDVRFSAKSANYCNIGSTRGPNTACKTVPTPACSISSSQTICAGNSAKFTASITNAVDGVSYTYAWTGPSGFVPPAESKTSIDVTLAGTYTVTVTDSFGQVSNGCSATLTVHQPPSLKVAASGATTFCVGGTANVTASGSNIGTITWYHGTTVLGTGSSLAFTPPAAGTYTVTAKANGNNACSGQVSDSVTVQADPKPSLTAAGGGTFCLGGSANLTASGSNIGTITWYNGDSPLGTGSSLAFTPTAAGTYTLTAKAKGNTSCTDDVSATVIVKADPKPSLTATGGATFCVGGTATLSASGENIGTITWYNGSTEIGSGSSVQFKPTAAGTYTLTAKASGTNTCSTESVSASVTVTADPKPAIAATGGATFCLGGSANLSATGSNIGAISWFNGENLIGTGPSVTFNPSAAGTYTLTAKATGTNACSTEVSDSVTVKADPKPTLTASGGSTFCLGGTANLTATGTNIGTITWYNGTTDLGTGSSLSFKPTAAGVYTLTAKASSANSCSDVVSASVTVTVDPKPALTATGGATFCIGGTATLSATGSNIGAITWFLGSDAIATGPSFNFTPANTGTYTLIARANGTNACATEVVSSSVTVTAEPKPVLTASGGATFCLGGTANLTATGSNIGAISWYNGEAFLGTGNALTFAPAAAGTYTLTAKASGSNSCKDAVTATVTVKADPKPSLTAAGGATFCVGGTANLTASGSNIGAITWYHGSTPLGTGPSISFTPTAAGTYTLTAKANGTLACSNEVVEAQVVVKADPKPTLLVTGGGAFCLGATATLAATGSNIGTISWFNGSTPLGTGASITFTPTATGTYTVTAKASGANACNDEVTASVTVKADPKPSLTASGGATFCIGGTANLTASGENIGPITWYNGPSVVGTGSSVPFAPAQAGTYTLVAKANGINACASDAVTASVVVKVDPKPTLSATGGSTFCIGGKATLSASGSNIGTISWFNGTVKVGEGTSFVFEPATVGTYTLTAKATGNNACQEEVSSSVTVTADAKPTLTAGGGATFCIGGTAALTATGSNIGTITWYNGDQPLGTGSSFNFKPPAAGTYTLTAKATGDNACKSEVSATVVVTADPKPALTASDDTTFCVGGTATLSASGSNIGTITWFNGSTEIGTGSSINFKPATAGTYTLIAKATGTNSCTTEVIDEVVVKADAKPTLTASGGATFCIGGTATVTASGSNIGTITWYADGKELGTGSSLNFTPDAPGSFTLTAKASGSNTCKDEVSAAVVVKAEPKPTFAAGADAKFCLGGSATLTAAGSNVGSIAWYDGETKIGSGSSFEFKPSAAGTYTLVAKTSSSNSCPAEFSDEVIVTVDPKPTLAASGDATFCFGSGGTSAELTANGTDIGAITWYHGSSVIGTGASVIFTPAAAGTYTLTAKATGTNACASEVSDTVIVKADPLSTASASGGGMYCYGARVTLTATGTAILSYSWRDPNGVVVGTGASYTFIVYSSNVGRYTMTAVSANGCGEPADVIVEVKGQDCQACTLTQGAWGSTGGAGSTANIRTLLTGAGLQVGEGSATFTAQQTPDATVPGQADCVMQFLPAGGRPTKLGQTSTVTANVSSDGTRLISCKANPSSLVDSKSGKFNNVLLGQTIALTLNIGFSDSALHPLANVALCKSMKTTKWVNNAISTNTADEKTVTIPDSVMKHLLNSGKATVAGLLELANQALGGNLPNGISYSDVNAAVDAINVGFDGCRVKLDCSNVGVLSATASTLASLGNSPTLCNFTSVALEQPENVVTSHRRIIASMRHLGLGADLAALRDLSETAREGNMIRGISIDDLNAVIDLVNGAVEEGRVFDGCFDE